MPASADMEALAKPRAASWLGRLRDSLRAWLRINSEAHAKAPARPCCSAPPPGAAHHSNAKDN
ncbi:MAG: hypothetical protein K9J43_03730 [Polynucleobacter sp.]|nr:hypothetical protein [Polynucleobacter sp.]